MKNISDQEVLNFCRRYPPMPNLLPFHYELFCRQKLENSLCLLGYSRKEVEAIIRRIPFEDLPKVTPKEIGAIWRAEIDAQRGRKIC